MKKRLSRNEPLAFRMAEGIWDQEPWVGFSLPRPAFLVELRNHILLKWAQSQTGQGRHGAGGAAARRAAASLPSQETRNAHAAGEAAAQAQAWGGRTGYGQAAGSSSSSSSSVPDGQALLALPSTVGARSPGEPQWTGQAEGAFKGPGARALSPSSYTPLEPLAFSEVVATLPRRYHEIAACVFDYLEARGAINTGAVKLTRAAEGLGSPRAWEWANRTRVPWPLPAPAMPTRLPPYVTIPGYMPHDIIGRIADRQIVPKGPQPSFRQKRVVIIGAGMAGLAAARQLLFYGHQVIIVEARDRPGGRISTHRTCLGMAVDRGAMISVGEEPNCFSLLARQLGIRTHWISTTPSPLLLPRQFHGRVQAMAAARQARAAGLEQLRAAQAAAKAAAEAAARAAAAKVRPTVSAQAGPEPESVQGPLVERTVEFLLNNNKVRIALDKSLCHVPDAAVKAVARINVVHRTLMVEHCSFLRRVLKALTLLAQAQVHDASAFPRMLPQAVLERYREERTPDALPQVSYGVLAQGAPIAPTTRGLMDAVYAELSAAQAWCAVPEEQQVLTLLGRAAGLAQAARDAEQAKRDAVAAQAREAKEQAARKAAAAAAAAAAALTGEAAPQSSPAKASGSLGSSTDPSLEGVPTGPDDLPLHCPVPPSIDAAVEGEFNRMLDSTTELRRKATGPHRGEVRDAALLLGKGGRADLEVPSKATVAPLANPLPGPCPAAVMGLELVSRPGLAAMGLKQAEQRDLFTAPDKDAVYPDSWNFKFDPAIDGGVTGQGIATWSMDVWPRTRPAKYPADPRRSDDSIDNDKAGYEPYPAKGYATARHGQDGTGPVPADYNPTEEGSGKPGPASQASLAEDLTRQCNESGAVNAAAGIAMAETGLAGPGPTTSMQALQRAALVRANPPKPQAGGAGAGSKSSSGAGASSSSSGAGKPLGPIPSSKTAKPRAVSLGYQAAWDVSLGRALEMVVTGLEEGRVQASQEDKDGLQAVVAELTTDKAQAGKGSKGKDDMDEDGTVGQANGSAVAAAAIKHVLAAVAEGEAKDKGSSGAGAGSSSSANASAVAFNITIPSLAEADRDSDGRLLPRANIGSGSGGSGSEPYPSGQLERVEPESLTYPALRRALLRWHVANLEYGCAAPLSKVSLQSWDQDDQFGHHDSGRHSYAKDGYDCHVRGLLAGMPEGLVRYGVEVQQVQWDVAGAGSEGGLGARLMLDASGTASASSSSAPVPLEADACIVTVPLGVLQSGKPSFTPELPQWKRTAMTKVGAGLLNKVILRFPTAFWRKGCGVESQRDLQVDSQADLEVQAGAGASGAAGALQAAQDGQGQAQAAATSLAIRPVARGRPRAGLRVGMLPGLPSRPPARPVSLVPFMDRLTSHFHLSPHWHSDSAMLTGLALALNAAGKWTRALAFPPLAVRLSGLLEDGAGAGAGASSSAAAPEDGWSKEPVPQPSGQADLLFSCLQTVAEARGDAGRSARLMFQWYGNGTAAQAMLQDATPTAAPGTPSAGLKVPVLGLAPGASSSAGAGASSSGGAGLVDEGDAIAAAEDERDWEERTVQAAEYCHKTFAIPAIPPPGTLVLPAGPGAGLGVVEEAAVAAGVKAAQEAKRSGKPAVEPVSTAPSKDASASAQSHHAEPESTAADRPSPYLAKDDDTFGRVVLGDSQDTARRRGEAYMFYCMDRPGRGAGVTYLGGSLGSAARVPAWAGQAASEAVGQAKEGGMDVDGEEGAGGPPVLIAMMAGDAAEWVETATDAQAVDSVVQALRDMFGAHAVPQPVASVVTRWRSDPYARGSYSYLTPGASGVHYDCLAMPLGSTCFFAGEATSRHHPTTAAGAYDSGVREAVRLAGMWGRARDPEVMRVLAARELRVTAVSQAFPPTTKGSSAAGAGAGPAASGK